MSDRAKGRKTGRKIIVKQWSTGKWWAEIPALGLASGPWDTEAEARIPADAWNASVNGR
jgi:hypothetical protein